MIVGLVLKSSVACRVGTLLAFEHNGASVRHN